MTDITAIGSMFVQWLQVHREAYEMYLGWQNFMHEIPDDPGRSKKERAALFEMQKEWMTKNTEAHELYSKLIEATDLHLAAQVTEIKND